MTTTNRLAIALADKMLVEHNAGFSAGLERASYETAPIWMVRKAERLAAGLDEVMLEDFQALQEEAFDTALEWAREQIQEYVPDVPFYTNAVIQPHFDALDSVPDGLGYSGYNKHIRHVSLTSALDAITPDFDPPEGHSPDDDPNPYRKSPTS